MTDRSVSTQKRDAILDAARSVFSRVGYAGSAMEDVAEEAGIAKGTLYLYFKSKEELYLAALVRDLRELTARAMTAMDAAPHFRDKLHAFLRVRVDYCKAHEDFLRIYLAEYGNMFMKSPLRQELCKLARDNMRAMGDIVDQAMRRGELRRAPAGPVAATIFDVARGLMERRLLGWKELQARDEIEFTVNLLWSGIGNSTGRRKGAP